MKRINEDGRLSPRPWLSEEDAKKEVDTKLFNTARLYASGRMGIRDKAPESSWVLDPRKSFPSIFDKNSDIPVGTGNQASVEFNLIYRWHPTISARDAEWSRAESQELFPGEEVGEIQLKDFFRKLPMWKAVTRAVKAESRTFGGLSRDSSGYFETDALAKLIAESKPNITHVTSQGSFGAHQVPEVLKPVVILGTIQAREWYVGTLNELRRYMGLKSHESFEDINPRPETQAAMQALYKEPDFVEMYPGLLFECAKDSVYPGSGLCAGSTMTRAIMSDAVALVRGDRFYTRGPMASAIKRQLASYKRIILCADGTWVASDRGDNSVPSNVARLARAIATSGLDNEGKIVKQIVSYNAGIGSGDLPLQRAFSGAFGWGLEAEVSQIYDFISNNYDPGDELFFFGWSRGAFTVRSVAGLVSDVGVLSARQMSHFPELWAKYREHNVGGTFRKTKWYEERQTQWGLSDATVKVVGVWDTVGALGIPEWQSVQKFRFWGVPINNKYKFHNTNVSERIDYAFQALALDEKRATFPPTLWHASVEGGPREKLEQCWFPGVHGTIGGTAPGEIGINTFAWMADNLSGMMTFERDSIDDLVAKHNEAVSSVARAWGCGPIVGNFSGLRNWLVWRPLGKKDRTPGNYESPESREDRTPESPEQPRTWTNETFHPMVRVRKEALADRYKPGSLDGFTWQQRDADNGRWYWVKDGTEVPEYQAEGDKSMTIAYKQGDDVNYDTQGPMSDLLRPRDTLQQPDNAG
ncbi:hypothetical protein BJY01DRAFT_248509 [Aspergillus pseudoustus]|uniref:T6SS Phospholipase effector Tle1-like catalytic domain-containing protein n=1 Tax=Aspergillus pseudoustus TaxID=1810923 RepID=A0ABR4JVW8_9EURO